MFYHPVSILVTAYNTQNYIEDCLDSIENQTYFQSNNKFEVLVGIDNCEKTLKKLKEIRYKYRNLRIFMMNSNKGTYITTNTLIEISKYNQIIRFDSDDIMMSGMIQRIMDFVNTHDLIRFSVYNVDGKEGTLLDPKSYIRHPHGVALFKKKIFDIYGGFQPWISSADTELLERIKYGGEVNSIVIDEPLFKRRIHQNSLTRRKDTGFGASKRKEYRKLIDEVEYTKIKNIPRIRNDYEEIYEHERPEITEEGDIIYSEEQKKYKTVKPPRKNKYKSILPSDKKFKHCHFSIVFNEIDFLRMKLPFLYDYFDQLIFFDLNAFGEIRFSDDGSHEYIKEYPDPKNKITLIENKEDIDKGGIYGRGMGPRIKQKMFTYGSQFVRDDINIFWCTDMDEFFNAELIFDVENLYENKPSEWNTIQVPYYNFWYNTDYVLTQDRKCYYDYGNVAVRIVKHTPGNIYGHCNIGHDYPPIYNLENNFLYHFSWIGERRVREKLLYYNISNNYIKDVWFSFSPKKFEKEKDKNGFYNYPNMSFVKGNEYNSGLVKFPGKIFKELPYLDKKIIKNMCNYTHFNRNLEETFLYFYLKTSSTLGDHLICYGFIKEIHEGHKKIILLTRGETLYMENVKRLYSTIPNVEVKYDDPDDPNRYMRKNIMILDRDTYLHDHYSSKPERFDKYYYDKIGVDYYLKWDNFYIERNLEKEKDVFYNKLGLKDEDAFVFLHENTYKNIKIDRKYINTNKHTNKKYSNTPLRIIEADEIGDISIFDLLYTLEKAKEIHVVNSAFLSFIDLAFISLNIKHTGLIYHKYTVKHNYEQPNLRLHWSIID